MFGLRPLRESREHTHSFYAATANTRTAFQTLTNDISAEVVVVGGRFFRR